MIWRTLLDWDDCSPDRIGYAVLIAIGLLVWLPLFVLWVGLREVVRALEWLAGVP